jgi:hypothetical protein
MDQLALSRLIRFGLKDLSARNGHHAFEELCRFLVAERIVSNVYPATGPVAAGGDSGRDFQTFDTHIRRELGPHGGFAALASGAPVAFACTLQAKAIPSKIRGDLRKIATGPPVELVYAMLGADLPAAKANEIKAEALEKNSITLEILDGQAIAELLTHHDTFWIAARWLAVPAEYAPERSDDPDEPQWYREDRERWRTAEHSPSTMGEVMDVRDGLRRATFHRHARPDLGMWLARMTLACESDGPLQLRQRARYETAVAQLRGAGDLRPADGHVVSFFDNLDPDNATWADLMDGSVLLQYVAGAAIRGRTGCRVDWIMGQNARLQKIVTERLRKKGITATEKAGLLDVLGHLRVHADLTAVELPEAPLDFDDPISDTDDGRLTYEPIPASVVLIDADGAIEAWTKFARLVPKAPLAPVDSLSTILSLLAPALVDRPGYRELVGLMDNVLADVAGNAAAGERSRDRALALLRQGRPLDALTDLHEAKVRWWQGDTVRGSLLALLLLARCYEQLGLFMAARQQALIAVGLAHAHGSDDEDLIAAGLMKAAHLDYRSGAWCAAVESYSVAMLAHLAYAEDPWNVERHQDLQAADLHSGYLRAAADFADPKLAARVRAAQKECGLSDVLDETEQLMPDRSAQELRDELIDQLEAVPYADAGPDRIIQWSALGITWQIRAVNTYAHCRAAERFASAAQILCAELAQEDLVLLPTTIRVHVQAMDASRTAGRERVRSEPGNDGSDWVIDLLPLIGDASNLDADEVAKELIVALTTVLYAVSLVNWTQHEQTIERGYSRGLPHKLSTGRAYDDCAAVVTSEHFEKSDRLGIRVPPEWKDVPVPAPVSALAWRNTPGPGYSKQKSEAMIRNRYKRSSEILCQTIPRLANDPQFRETYEVLVGRGWKDWHVLLALVNARINFRIHTEHPTVEQLMKLRRQEPQHQAESENEAPLPPEWLTVERLDEMRRFAFATGTTHWDLEIHQDTPDLMALEQLLGDRYGYWSDDVPHASLIELSPKESTDLP